MPHCCEIHTAELNVTDLSLPLHLPLPFLSLYPLPFLPPSSLTIKALPQFAYSQPSLWTARQGDEVTLPCTITNALEGIEYKTEWKKHGGESYTIESTLSPGEKYSISDEHLMIRNITEDDTSAQYTCAVTGLSMEGHNDLQGRRPSSGLMQIKLLSE